MTRRIDPLEWMTAAEKLADPRFLKFIKALQASERADDDPYANLFRNLEIISAYYEGSEVSQFEMVE